MTSTFSYSLADRGHGTTENCINCATEGRSVTLAPVAVGIAVAVSLTSQLVVAGRLVVVTIVVFIVVRHGVLRTRLVLGIVVTIFLSVGSLAVVGGWTVLGLNVLGLWGILTDAGFC